MVKVILNVDPMGKYLIKLSRLWRDEASINEYSVVLKFPAGEVEINPLCVEGSGCQGSIIYRLGNTEVFADMKRGRITWLVGDVLKDNDISDFIRWLSEVYEVTRAIEPVLKLIPPEYGSGKWVVEVSVRNRKYELPEFLRGDIDTVPIYEVEVE